MPSYPPKPRLTSFHKSDHDFYTPPDTGSLLTAMFAGLEWKQVHRDRPPHPVGTIATQRKGRFNEEFHEVRKYGHDFGFRYGHGICRGFHRRHQDPDAQLVEPDRWRPHRRQAARKGRRQGRVRFRRQPGRLHRALRGRRQPRA
ncbi:protein of unknown function [Aminobacter niigataensis]|nr:protein of unknown function [Aminobacter niigataensis]